MKQIADTIGLQIARISREHRQHAEDALSKLGVHVGQEIILCQLWEKEGLPQSQIASCIGVEAPTITKMLHRMEKSGLVLRRQDCEDARVSRVYLTEYGRSLEEPVLCIWRELEARTLQNLTVTEQMLLHRLLLQVRTNLISE